MKIRLIAAWTVISALAGTTPCLAQIGPGVRPPVPVDPLPDGRAPSGVDIRPFAQPVPGVKDIGKVRVTRFLFTGLTAFDASELQPVVAGRIGRELTPAELSAILHDVTEYLRKRGLYLALAYLPDQQVKDGVVEIAVLEGRIGAMSLEVEPGSRLTRKTAEGFLSDLQSGTLIARGLFDTPLLLLNDLPGVRVSSQLNPAAAPGTADLQVHAADEPLVAASLRLDNYEIPEVGRYDITAYIRLRNPAGIGDLAAGELRSTHTGDRTRATLSYSIPVNHAGTRAAVVIGEQRYAFKGDFEPLRANGDFNRVTLAVTHPFLRTHDANIHGSFSLNQYLFRDRFDAFNFETSARHRYATALVSGDRADAVLGGGRTTGYVEMQTGEVELDAQAAALDAQTLRVNGRFTRWRAGAQRVQFVSSDSELAATLFGQLASKNLAPNREFELGGPRGVRAYPVSEMYPDEGYIARLIYNHRLFSNAGWSALGGVFWDTGRGVLNKNPLPGAVNNARTLSGVGVRLVVARRDLCDIGVTLAWRTTGQPVADQDRHPRAWFWTTAYF